jgi:hypothetical protein
MIDFLLANDFHVISQSIIFFVQGVFNLVADKAKNSNKKKFSYKTKAN